MQFLSPTAVRYSTNNEERKREKWMHLNDRNELPKKRSWRKACAFGKRSHVGRQSWRNAGSGVDVHSHRAFRISCFYAVTCKSTGVFCFSIESSHQNRQVFTDLGKQSKRKNIFYTRLESTAKQGACTALCVLFSFPFQLSQVFQTSQRDRTAYLVMPPLKMTLVRDVKAWGWIPWNCFTRAAHRKSLPGAHRPYQTAPGEPAFREEFTYS